MSAAEATEFVNEVWGLQGVAYAVVALRYYARVSKTGWKSLGWDDTLMFFATLVYTAESVAAYMVVAFWAGFANNGMTEEQRATLDPSSTEYTLRVNGSKTHVTGLLLYATLLWLLKGCWVIYYARLTQGLTSRYRLVQIGAVMMIVTYIACVLVAVLKCIPFDHQWQINPSPGNNCMPAVSTLQTVFVMVMNTITDIYLMMIPIPMIWKAQLPLKKKLSIILLFSGGIVEIVFGLMRCISILTLGDTDPAQSGFWSVRESFVSFVLTNLPFIYPLIKSYVDKTRSSANKSGNLTGERLGGTGKQGYRLDSMPGDRSGRRERAGSQEHIVSLQHPERQYPTTTLSTKPSHDDSASLDSVTLAAYGRDLPSPGHGISRTTAYAQVVSSTAGRPPQGGDSKGIVVTRSIDISQS